MTSAGDIEIKYQDDELSNIVGGTLFLKLSKNSQEINIVQSWKKNSGFSHICTSNISYISEFSQNI